MVDGDKIQHNTRLRFENRMSVCRMNNICCSQKSPFGRINLWILFSSIIIGARKRFRHTHHHSTECVLRWIHLPFSVGTAGIGVINAAHLLRAGISVRIIESNWLPDMCSKFMCINRICGDLLVNRTVLMESIRKRVPHKKNGIEGEKGGQLCWLIFIKPNSQATTFLQPHFSLWMRSSTSLPFATHFYYFHAFFFSLSFPSHSVPLSFIHLVELFVVVWMQLTHFFDIINEKPKCTTTIY